MRIEPSLLFLFCWTRSTLAENERPNILLFLVDDLGHGDLGYLGHPTSSSPHIDQLARDSVQLTQFYTASAVCSPSRASLMTGRHPQSVGLYPGVLFADSLQGLPLEVETIAESLSASGYRTAMTGKWHLGVGPNNEFLPTQQGFSSYLGIPYSHDICTFHGCFPSANGDQSEACDLPTPWPQMPPCPLYQDEQIIQQPVDLTTLTRRYTDFAEEFILRESAEPFFLFYSFQHVHFPQFSSLDFRNSSLRGAFGDSISEMDAAVGRLVDTLRAVGALDNTLLFITSDNGARSLPQGNGQGGSSGLFKCGKGTTYEGGHRVPALLHWPSRIPPRRESGLVSMMDIPATLAALVGGSYNSFSDGFDLLPSLLDGEPWPREEIVFIDHNESNGTINALRLGAYKAHWVTEGNIMSYSKDIACIDVQRRHDPPLLYNVEADPQELYKLTRDTFADYDEVMRSMEERRTALESGDIFWAESVTKERGKEGMPCCNQGCEPFPSCCTCGQEQK